MLRGKETWPPYHRLGWPNKRDQSLRLARGTPLERPHQEKSKLASCLGEASERPHQIRLKLPSCLGHTGAAISKIFKLISCQDWSCLIKKIEENSQLGERFWSGHIKADRISRLGGCFWSVLIKETEAHVFVGGRFWIVAGALVCHECPTSLDHPLPSAGCYSTCRQSNSALSACFLYVSSAYMLRPSSRKIAGCCPTFKRGCLAESA